MKFGEFFYLEEDAQPRVAQGAKTQKIIASNIKNLATAAQAPAKVLKYAPASSQGADIIMKIGGEQVQIEAKSRRVPHDLIKIIEETVRRGSPGIRLLPALSRLGYPKGMTQYIDTMRKKGLPAGFTGDPGAPPSGSIGGVVRITDPAVCGSFRKQFIQQLQESGDNYFAIETQSTGNVSIYHTGLGGNPLKCPPLPRIKFALMNTYGAAVTPGTVRVAIKAMFIP